MRIKRLFLLALVFFMFLVASAPLSSSKALQTEHCPGDPCGCDRIYDSCRRGCNSIPDIRERFACANRCVNEQTQCNIDCCGILPPE
jgi:hypothetical protein